MIQLIHCLSRRQSLKRFTSVAVMLLMMMISANPVAQAQGSAARERKVKVAYLYNFIRYIQWPNSAFSNDKDPFVIGILANDPHGRMLDHIASKKKAMGRQIQVKRFPSVGAIANCHMIFVTGNIAYEDQMLAIERSQVSKALLICDTTAADADSAPIRFFMDQDGTVGLQININAMQKRGLKPDAKLLKIATVIQG